MKISIAVRFKYTFLTCISIFLFNISICQGQEATIDKNFKIVVSEMFSPSLSETDGEIEIDISQIEFENEAEAKKVFEYYSKHPCLNFELEFDKAKVLMIISDMPFSSDGEMDIDYLNNLLLRRSIAFGLRN